MLPQLPVTPTPRPSLKALPTKATVHAIGPLALLRRPRFSRVIFPLIGLVALLALSAVLPLLTAPLVSVAYVVLGAGAFAVLPGLLLAFRR